MIAVSSYNRVEREQNIIEKGCRDQVAKRTDDRLSFMKAALYDGASGEESDIIYYEVTGRDDIERLKRLRQKDDEAFLMLLASPKVSPMQYLKPGISPDLLLLRPFGQSDFDQVNRELFDTFLSARQVPDTDGNFVLSTRDGRRVFPYDRILYFEACNKKINLRTRSEEFGFYDSIENILHRVPDSFIRCHRAYLVNVKKIRKVRMSDGLIEMDGGALVPLSRTYKQGIKEWMG